MSVVKRKPGDGMEDLRETKPRRTREKRRILVHRSDHSDVHIGLLVNETQSLARPSSLTLDELGGALRR